MKYIASNVGHSVLVRNTVLARQVDMPVYILMLQCRPRPRHPYHNTSDNVLCCGVIDLLIAL